MITMRSEGLVDSLNEHCYHILGCGAIGSSAALQIARTGGEDFVLYDFDKVAIENVGVSQYTLNDIELPKVVALKNHIIEINPQANVVVQDAKANTISYMDKQDIVILGFDNMLSRREVVEDILYSKYMNPYLLIDGRMGGEHYQQYTFTEKNMKNYFKHWYSDDEGDAEPCNIKATSYCSNMAGSFITNAIRKVLTNSPYETVLTFNFPTMTLEKQSYFPK